MSRITILPDILASQVAAGEVVERPSSVLKELIENALDADATQIEVDIRKGGAALLRVTDNGHGMNKENALLSVERHATSKIQTSEDLARITTHGFRGEALPSIASVSRFRMLTYDGSATPATELIWEGGTMRNLKQSARSTGTTVEIKDLFFNVPARRKFLKSESTEYAHTEHAIRVSALGHPQVRYIFRNNGRVIWDLKPTKDRRTRIGEFQDQQTIEALVNIPEYHFGTILISGYLLPGRHARGTGKSQTVFINERPIDDSVIRSAIRDGYHGQIQPGQFPVVWLWVTMPPEDLDVNVHPAKREVRFQRPSEIKHAITSAIQSAFSSKPPNALSPPRFLEQTKEHSAEVSPPLNSDQATPMPELSQPTTESLIASTSLENKQDETTPQHPRQWDTGHQEELPTSSDKHEPNPNPTAFSLIGTLKNRYWLMEDENGLVVFDPKTARERITYDALRDAHKTETIHSQALLIPLLLELDPHDSDTVKSNLEALNSLGIEITSFGGTTYQVQALPSLIEISEKSDTEQFLYAVIDELETAPNALSAHTKEKVFESLLLTIAKQVGNTQSTRENYALGVIGTLMMCDLPYCAPDGRPTMIHYAERVFAKKFER